MKKSIGSDQNSTILWISLSLYFLGIIFIALPSNWIISLLALSIIFYLNFWIQSILENKDLKLEKARLLVYELLSTISNKDLVKFGLSYDEVTYGIKEFVKDFDQTGLLNLAYNRKDPFWHMSYTAKRFNKVI